MAHKGVRCAVLPDYSQSASVQIIEVNVLLSRLPRQPGRFSAFRAGRHRAYLSLGRCQNPLHPQLLRPQTRTAEPLPDQGAYPAIWCRSLVRSQDRRSLRSESRCQFRHHALLLGRAFGAAASPAREARKSSSDTAYFAANLSWLRCSWRSNFASRKRPHASCTAALSPHQVANMIATTTAIVAVDNHPIAHSARGSTKSPITSWRIAMSMMITINGTATTPLITADQNNALIGSRPTKLMPTPMRVEIAIVT